MPYSADGRYFPPAVRVTICPRTPEFVSRTQRTFSRTVTGPGMTKGRTNGMPWDGTSPCTAGSVPDSHKHADKPLGKGRSAPETPIMFWDVCRMWNMPSNPWFPTSWIGLSTQLAEMANVMLDADLASEMQLLADVAYQRWLDTDQ